MDPVDVAFSGMSDQARMLRDGEISSPELVQLCLDRVTRLDPLLRAFTVVRVSARNDPELNYSRCFGVVIKWLGPGHKKFSVGLAPNPPDAETEQFSPTLERLLNF